MLFRQSLPWLREGELVTGFQSGRRGPGTGWNAKYGINYEFPLSGVKLSSCKNVHQSGK